MSGLMLDSISIRTRHCVLLVCVLLGAYLLIYANTPDSADGAARLAVAAAQFHYGGADMNAIAYADAFIPLQQARMGSMGSEGALYSKKGPTGSLVLLPFVAAADWLPWLSLRATAMFFNILVTIATALALYIFVEWLGYRARTAFAAALIYGLMTFAFVYAKTLYVEPLAGLLLLLALMLMYRDQGRGSTGKLAAAGLMLGLMVGTNMIYAVLLGIFGLYVLSVAIRRRSLMPALAFGIPAALCLAVILGFNWARFGSPLSTGYELGAGEDFSHPFIEGMYGLLISPYRGIFWYNPVLLLVIPGAWWMRKHGRLVAALLGLALLQCALFASWWSWGGGAAWGPRFLIPAIPLLVICLAEVIERAWSSRWLFVGLGVLAVFSFGIQILGALYSALPFTSYLNAVVWHSNLQQIAVGDVGIVLTHLELSPILGQLALVSAGWPLDPAWLANGVDVVHLVIALGVVVLGFALAALRIPNRVRIVVCAIGVVLALNGVGALQAVKPDVQQIEALGQTLQPADTIYAMTTKFGNSILDLKSRARVITVNAPTERADSLWDYTLAHSQRLWLLTWFPPADPQNWQERELWQSAAFVTEREVEGHRAVAFDRSADPADKQVAGDQFGAIRLLDYAIALEADGVRLTVDWSAATVPTEADSWFIHLVNPNGEITAQQDRQPQGGYAPTNTWSPGEAVTDRLLFPVQVSDLTGWKLRVGWINPANGDRLAVTSPDGTAMSEGYIEIPLGK